MFVRRPGAHRRRQSYRVARNRRASAQTSRSGECRYTDSVLVPAGQKILDGGLKIGLGGVGLVMAFGQGGGPRIFGGEVGEREDVGGVCSYRCAAGSRGLDPAARRPGPAGTGGSRRRATRGTRSIGCDRGCGGPGSGDRVAPRRLMVEARRLDVGRVRSAVQVLDRGAVVIID
jgi:hypothetical protein